MQINKHCFCRGQTLFLQSRHAASAWLLRICAKHCARSRHWPQPLHGSVKTHLDRQESAVLLSFSHVSHVCHWVGAGTLRHPSRGCTARTPPWRPRRARCASRTPSRYRATLVPEAAFGSCAHKCRAPDSTSLILGCGLLTTRF